MNIPRPQEAHTIHRRIRHWTVGWLAPIAPSVPLPDLKDDASAIRKLRSIFEDTDEFFLLTFERCLALQKVFDKRSESYNDWKINLLIQQEDYEVFISKVSHDDLLLSNTEYIQDHTKLRYWQMAIDFLVYENDGFPGRMAPGVAALHSKADPDLPFPRPQVSSIGWSSRLLEIEAIASHLPEHVVDLARTFGPLPEDFAQSLRKRIRLLDSLLDRTHVRAGGDRWISIGLQIEHSWPQNVPKERFAPSSMVALAYPQSLNRPKSGPTTTLIVSISSVLSGILSILAYLKSPHIPGSVQDADFFSLLQSSSMQISSLAIMMLAFRSIRLMKEAKMYAWILAAFGMLTSILAVPAYLLVPTGWSTLFAAAGGIAQGWITLQLVYSVSG